MSAYLLVNSTIQDQLNSDTTRHTNSLSHSRVPTGHTILAKSGSTSLLLAILVLDLELVLQHDKITLTLLILHLLLESSAESIERVTTGSDLLVTEEADPAKTGDDAVAVIVVSEGRLGGNGPLEVLLGGGGGAEDLLRGLLPGNGAVEVLAALVGQEADVNQNLDHLGEALVAEGAADDGLGFGDVVALPVGAGVAVGVGDEGEAGVDEVGLGGGHQVGTGDAEFLAVLVELGGVAEGKEDTAAGPAELVAKGVVGALGGGWLGGLGWGVWFLELRVWMNLRRPPQ